MRRPCEHGVTLQKGLVCNRGYLFIRVYPMDRPVYLEGCGPHTPMNQKAAEIKLAEHRKRLALGDFSPKRDQAVAMTVDEVLDLYMPRCKVKNRKVLESVVRRLMRPAFGHHRFDLVTPKMARRWREAHEKDVDPHTGEVIKSSTVNRDQAVISAVWSTIERWVKLEEDGIPAIRLPEENPFKYVKKSDERIYARDRVPNREEMRAAKAWCLANDPGLWQAIERATLTALRRSDLKDHNEKGGEDGIQGKTGKRFKVYAQFPLPLDLTNWRRRWDALRRALGWDVEGTATHTVWHDIRHWGPTILAELGYAGKLLQKVTGHATEAMVDKYTGLRKEKLVEAVAALKREMDSL